MAMEAETTPFIAGLTPGARPVGAPEVVRYEPGAGWTAWALRGIAAPQNGVGFLKDQGAWYTPFTRPNLTGRYDIRGLHQAAPRKD